MFRKTDDLRIEGIAPLIAPAILMEDFPLTEAGSTTVAQAREDVARIIEGEDDRLFAVVGPCSIHDPDAAIEYARLLAAKKQELAADLVIAMRVYFEKPRTTVGWKGLINDPDLDNSFAINEGLRTARRFLLSVLDLDLPAGSEFLDPITPQFYADLVSWGAIGARTSESQVHRELASGLSMPVGFKNGTRGNVDIALDGMMSSLHPHHFLSVTKQGVAAIVSTKGNPHCHVILRGGKGGPNFSSEHVNEVSEALESRGRPGNVMIDCSHANSGKKHEKQPAVAADVGKQVADGSQRIFGFMLESFLEEGRQDHDDAIPGGGDLVRGQSITDACMNWKNTEDVLEGLAEAVRQRRKKIRS